MQFLANRRWRLLILVAALVLILASRSFLYVNFVQPIALFLWAAWRVMASVNQNVYWTLLLAAGFMPLLWMLISTKAAPARSAYRQDSLPPARLEHWARLLAGANGSQKDRDRFLEDWDRLLRSVEEQAGRSDQDDFSGDAPGQNNGHPEISHLKTRINSGRGRVPPVQKIWLLLPESAQRRLSSFARTDDQWVRESLSWMESELDIPYEN